MRRMSACGVLLCSSMSVWAGNGTFALPVLERSAASVAIGDGAAAFVSGVNALGVNPAGLTAEKREFSTQYQQFPLDVNLGGAAFVLPLGAGRFSLGASYSSLKSDNLEKRSDSGAEQGTFSHQDQILGLHLSFPIKFGAGDLSGGLSAKMIHSRVESYSGSGAAFDGGLRYGFKQIPLTLAATALNLGKGPQLKDAESPLPTSYALAGSYAVIKPLVLVGSAAILPKDDRSDLSLGVDYNVADRLALRGSYTLEAGSAKDEADLSGFAGGIGLTFGIGTFDYAFQPAAPGFDDAGGSHHATLTLRF